MADEVRYPRMSTAELRGTFLVEDFFELERVKLVYVDMDRTVIGSAVPIGSELELPCPEELRAVTFTERRELGVFNIGGPGAVSVGRESYALGNRDALYIGNGAG
jgi:4-deoxy-L-threo-5-hexosulose-uronate ketol-isomerase